MTTIAIIVAAGRGTRAGGDVPKQWQMLFGKRVLDWTIDAFQSHPKIDDICVVLHPDDVDLLNTPSVMTCIGGENRNDSVKNGLKAISAKSPDRVLIHDAARATVEAFVIDGVLSALDTHEAAAPALAVTDALWHGSEGLVTGVQDRSTLFRAQTPQGFKFNKILEAHEKNKKTASDDVEVARRFGLDVAITLGSEDNLKITTPQDFARADRILRNR